MLLAGDVAFAGHVGKHGAGSAAGAGAVHSAEESIGADESSIQQSSNFAEWHEGQPCEAVFDEDGLWYAGMITSVRIGRDSSCDDPG